MLLLTMCIKLLKWSILSFITSSNYFIISKSIKELEDEMNKDIASSFRWKLDEIFLLNIEGSSTIIY